MSLKPRIKVNSIRNKKPSISVVSPVYNNATVMIPIIEEILTLLSEHCSSYELILIDDASTDQSKHILNKLSKQYSHLVVSFHSQNQGTSSTYKELYAQVKYDGIVLFSLDGEWDPVDIIQLMNAGKTADIVIGNRQRKVYPPGRKFLSYMFNRLCFFLFGVQTIDAGSIKFISHTVITQIPIVSTSVFDEAERIIRAKKRGFRITSIPVNHRGSNKPKGVLNRVPVIKQAINDLCRIWYLYTIGKL